MEKLREYSFPGKEIRLELCPSESLFSQQELASLASQTLSTIEEDLFTTLTLDILLDYFDAELGFVVSDSGVTRNFLAWFLYREGSFKEENISPFWVDSHIRKVKTINKEALLSWIPHTIEKAGSQNDFNQKAVVISWRNILIRASEVLLPQKLSSTTEKPISIISNYSTIKCPVTRRNGQVYVRGSSEDRSILPPLEIQLVNEYGCLTLTIRLYWSLWDIPGTSNWLNLHNSIERLKKQQNWLCTFSVVEGIEPDPPPEYAA